MNIVICHDHLGGFVRGGDSDTFDPVVWDKFIKDFGVKSLLDIGCGDGYAMSWFKSAGLYVEGIDGSEKVLESSIVGNQIHIHDFVTGPCSLSKKFDAVWSSEFVEHVEAKYIDNFMQSFCLAPLVLMTYSEPKWSDGGYHHVNCQTQEYWNSVFGSYGYSLDKDKTDEYRTLATARWIKPTISLYRK